MSEVLGAADVAVAVPAGPAAALPAPPAVPPVAAAAAAAAELPKMPEAVLRTTPELQQAWAEADSAVRVLERDLVIARARRTAVVQSIKRHADKEERIRLAALRRVDAGPAAPAAAEAPAAVGLAEDGVAVGGDAAAVAVAEADAEGEEVVLVA